MAGIQTLTAPANLALDIKDVKNFLRLDENDDEIYVRGLILAATEYVENYIERSLINRTLKLSIDTIADIDIPLWEGMRDGPDIVFKATYIDLPKSPVSSVTSVTTFDDNDEGTLFAASNYYLDTASTPARIVLRSGETWPTGLRVANAIEIIYIAGYGNNPKTIPEQIRLAMMQYIGFMYEHRGDTENPAPSMPSSIEVLLHSYRTMNFSKSPFATTRRLY